MQQPGPSGPRDCDKCGVCGGGLIAHSRASGPRRKHAYLCSYYHLRGTTVCPTGVLLPMDETNQAVLEAFEREVLHPDVVAVGFRHGLELLKPTEESVVPRREALQADLAVLDQELARFTSAVAQGGDLPALVEAIKVREQRKRQVLDELAGLDGLQQVASIDLRQLQSELQARLGDWQGLLDRQVPVARQIIKKLLAGRIVFRQREDGSYEFSGQVSLGRIIAGLACTKAVVSPTGTTHPRLLIPLAPRVGRGPPSCSPAASGRPEPSGGTSSHVDARRVQAYHVPGAPYTGAERPWDGVPPVS